MKAEIKVKVKKLGDSAVIRIPLDVLEGAHLNLEKEVVIREEKGRIIVEPIHIKKFNLKSLLEGITPNNLHSAVDFEEPQGKAKKIRIF